MRQFIERDLGDTAEIILEEFGLKDDEVPQKDDGALVDIVRTNSDGLSSMECIGFEEAREIIRTLAEEGMSVSALFRRVVNSSYPAELFAFLVELFGDTPRRTQLIDALVALPWGEYRYAELELQDFVQWFASTKDFKHLLARHREYLLDKNKEQLPFDPTSYWIDTVRWYIVKCDFRRAWDEWRHAVRGFYFGKPEHLLLGKADPRDYRFQAPPGVCDVLIRELIDAIVAMGEMKPLEPGEHLLEKVRLHMLHERSARRSRKIARHLHALPSPL
jgi:hypothetical protein